MYVFHLGSECMLFRLQLCLQKTKWHCATFHSPVWLLLPHDWDVNLFTVHVSGSEDELYVFSLRSPCPFPSVCLCLSLRYGVCLVRMRFPGLQHPLEASRVCQLHVTSRWALGLSWVHFSDSQRLYFHTVLPLPSAVMLYSTTESDIDKTHSALWELFLCHLQSLKTLCVVIGKHIIPVSYGQNTTVCTHCFYMIVFLKWVVRRKENMRVYCLVKSRDCLPALLRCKLLSQHSRLCLGFLARRFFVLAAYSWFPFLWQSI